MIEIHWRGGRPGADGPFYALLILGLGLVAGLLGFILHYSPAVAAQAVDACLAVSESTYTLSTALLVPWSFISIVVGFALVSVVWQLLATRHLIGSLLRRRVPVPDELTSAARAVGIEALDLVEDKRPLAFCYGFAHPAVCLTTGMLDLLNADELRAVLLHEAHHVVSRDPLKILISRALGIGLFFLPAAQDLRDRYLVGKEIAADASAARVVRSELPLASALLKLLSHGGATLPSTVAAIGAFNLTEERIQRMVRGAPVERARLDGRRLLLSGLVVGLIYLASYLSLAAAAQAATSVDECSQTTLVGR
ncbi:MAG: M56 family metallopeptidase [Anaerolineae bacterium]|nr:M56 family metallopeptidase [Anaerolineae bacterium]